MSGDAVCSVLKMALTARALCSRAIRECTVSKGSGTRTVHTLSIL